MARVGEYINDECSPHPYPKPTESTMHTSEYTNGRSRTLVVLMAVLGRIYVAYVWHPRGVLQGYVVWHAYYTCGSSVQYRDFFLPPLSDAFQSS